MSRPYPAYCFERLCGAALGTMCGDALGMPLEGMDPEDIQSRHGLISSMLPGRLPAGSYTDDTQMMTGILEVLAELGELDPALLAERFAQNFQPERGYGARIHEVVRRIQAGLAWHRCGTDSWGNGGAMRVGVLGAYYPLEPEELLKAALEQCGITHTHPQAMAMSLAQAMAVGLACRLGEQGIRPRPKAVCQGLAVMVEDIDRDCAARLLALPGLLDGDPKAVRAGLIWEYACDVKAIEAVPPALGCFLAADSARQAVEMAVSLGGDTDSIAAMTGALAGAYWGMDAWPDEWLDALENQGKGKDYIIGLCKHAIDVKNS
jgi:ADP-ribosylglycohydrolase